MVDDGVVREHVLRLFLVDELADAVAHGLGGMRFPAFSRAYGGGKEITQFKNAPRSEHVFIGGDAADGGFVHANGIGHRLQVERLEVTHAADEKSVLPADDLVCRLLLDKKTCRV